MLADSNGGSSPADHPSARPPEAEPEPPPALPEPPTAPAAHDRFTIRTYVLPEPVVQFADRGPRTAEERAAAHRRRRRRQWRRRVAGWFTFGHKA